METVRCRICRLCLVGVFAASVVELRPVPCFGAPRVVCHGFGEWGDGMQSLRADTERRVVASGCRSESTSFRGDLNLRRCTGDAGGEWTELGNPLFSCGLERVWGVLDRVTLSQSFPGPSGGTHRGLDAVPLCGTGPLLEGDY